MKAVTSSLTILLVIVFISAISCKKDQDTLPPETQDGRGSFGCKINGAIWLPNGTPFHTPSFIAEANDSNLIITTNKGVGESLNIVVKNTILKETARYTFGSDNIYAEYFKKNVVSNVNYICNYKTGSDYTGELIISKINLAEKIVSGTFNFRLNFLTENGSGTPVNCDTSIQITEGRFDLKYTEY